MTLLPAQAGEADASTPSKEYQVKAVFLFNFAHFVEWPPAAFGADDSPLVIGVLGDDPFGSVLDEVVRGERVHGHPLRVERYLHADEAVGCHILFISGSVADNLDAALANLKGHAVLTVSDEQGFSRRGVMIRFVTEKGRIRLRINLDAARSQGLMISSKLLRPAEIVKGDSR